MELIHMNGRVYDYALGRFLSVDPFIQFPLNSQSLNPYSYILNNPLAGTDPTGYLSSICQVGKNPNAHGCDTGSTDTTLPDAREGPAGKGKDDGRGNGGQQGQGTGEEQRSQAPSSYDTRKFQNMGDSKFIDTSGSALGDAAGMSTQGSSTESWPNVSVVNNHQYPASWDVYFNEPRIDYIPMSMDQAGLAALASAEGPRLHLYNDHNLNATIGIGHLVHMGPIDGRESERSFTNGISNPQMLDFFQVDHKKYEGVVNSAIRAPMKQHEFNGMVMLAYRANIPFRSTEVARNFNNWNISAASSSFMNWSDHGTNMVRPTWEKQIFDGKGYQSPW